MSNLLCIGVGPLPQYSGKHLFSFGIRAWQFIQPLLQDGHKITLATCEFGIHEKEKLPSPCTSIEGVKHYPLPEPKADNRPEILCEIQKICNGISPDGIITIGAAIAGVLGAELDYSGPMWIDIPGDPFTELQAGLKPGSEDILVFFLETHLKMLRRGDKFSSISESQRKGLVGQLGMMGRLVQETSEYEFAYAIPNNVDPHIPPVEHKKSVIRNVLCRDSDFVLLWSGGFNTWVDIPTLFCGIDEAMNRNKDIHLVCTGGGVPGHYSVSYETFKNRVETSPNKERYHLLGWVDYDDVPYFPLEADLGINVDKIVYEAEFGSRNRMIYWMDSGLPGLTTRTTELSIAVEEAGAGIVIDPKSSELLCSEILKAAEKREALKEMGKKAKEFVRTKYNRFVVTESLREWCKNPKPSPDLSFRRKSGVDKTALDIRLDQIYRQPVEKKSKGWFK